MRGGSLVHKGMDKVDSRRNVRVEPMERERVGANYYCRSLTLVTIINNINNNISINTNKNTECSMERDV